MNSCCTGPTSDAGDRPIGPFVAVTDSIPEADVLRSAGFAIVRQGRPAPTEELARATGLDVDRVRSALADLVDCGAAELDQDGHLVGIGGLSLAPTRHELVLDGVHLYTWCGYDALGIPPAAGGDARARSRCAHCGQAIEVTFRAGDAQGAPTVLTWFPGLACRNVRRDFCEAANLFCHHKHLDAWRTAAGDPPGEALDIAEVADRGRVTWGRDTRWVEAKL